MREKEDDIKKEKKKTAATSKRGKKAQKGPWDTSFFFVIDLHQKLRVL